MSLQLPQAPLNPTSPNTTFSSASSGTFSRQISLTNHVADYALELESAEVTDPNFANRPVSAMF